jgi:hypothetical protein
MTEERIGMPDEILDETISRKVLLKEIILWYQECQRSKKAKDKVEWNNIILLLTHLGFYPEDYSNKKEEKENANSN